MMEGITILVSPQWTSMITNQGILVERACLILHALANSKKKVVHYECYISLSSTERIWL
jgi:hypothetical protein